MGYFCGDTFCVFVISVIIYSVKPQEGVFKCHHGQPLPKNSSISCYDANARNQTCPADYICVKRHDYSRGGVVETWRGCCPEGDGPCHKEAQPIDPIESHGDRHPPECDEDGNYKSKQCHIFGCVCVFPNGTELADSSRDWSNQWKVDCDKEILPYMQAVSTDSTITTLPATTAVPMTTTPLSTTVVPVTTTPPATTVVPTTPSAKNAVFKCHFGEAKEFSAGGSCPADYMAVNRTERGLPGFPTTWKGCCPRGNGTCHTSLQKFDNNVGMAKTPVLPRCDDNGLYLPVQCRHTCGCVLPDGTPVTTDNDVTGPDDSEECVLAIKRSLGECAAGKWGYSCQEVCSCGDQPCDRLTGSCQSAAASSSSLVITVSVVVSLLILIGIVIGVYFLYANRAAVKKRMNRAVVYRVDSVERPILSESTQVDELKNPLNV